MVRIPKGYVYQKCCTLESLERSRVFAPSTRLSCIRAHHAFRTSSQVVVTLCRARQQDAMLVCVTMSAPTKQAIVDAVMGRDKWACCDCEPRPEPRPEHRPEHRPEPRPEEAATEGYDVTLKVSHALRQILFGFPLPGGKKDVITSRQTDMEVVTLNPKPQLVERQAIGALVVRPRGDDWACQWFLHESSSNQLRDNLIELTDPAEVTELEDLLEPREHAADIVAFPCEDPGPDANPIASCAYIKAFAFGFQRVVLGAVAREAVSDGGMLGLFDAGAAYLEDEYYNSYDSYDSYDSGCGQGADRMKPQDSSLKKESRVKRKASERGDKRKGPDSHESDDGGGEACHLLDYQWNMAIGSLPYIGPRPSKLVARKATRNHGLVNIIVDLAPFGNPLPAINDAVGVPGARVNCAARYLVRRAVHLGSGCVVAQPYVLYQVDVDDGSQGVRSGDELYVSYGDDFQRGMRTTDTEGREAVFDAALNRHAEFRP